MGGVIGDDLPGIGSAFEISIKDLLETGRLRRAHHEGHDPAQRPAAAQV